MCGQHTTQQTLAILDVNIERAHAASFAAVLSRLAFLETENSALQVRVTTLEGISTSSSAPLSDLAQHHQPPSPPLQHPATPHPEFRPLPSPSPTAMHPSPSPLSSDQLAGSDPLSSLNATLLSDQQGSVGTTLSSHPRAGTPPPPPASGHECVAVSTSNSFGPLASLAAVDTDQTTPTPSPDVQQTRASSDLNESGKGKPSTKGQDVTDRRLAPREQLFRSSLDDPRVSMLLVGDSVLKDIDIRKITPTSATMHKLYVPGMTCEDLAAWLRKQPPKVQMQEVIFHVGVNSVHHGPVSEKSWFDLVSLFRRAYPRASLRASSILPSCRASRSFRLNISQSNNALLSVCVRTGVQYIDNTVTFQTQTGAPRQALYKDQKHPSHRGVISLAWNFRFAGKTTARLNEQDVPRHSPRHLNTKVMSHDTSHSNKNTPQEQRQLYSEAVKSRAKPIVYQPVLSQTSHSKHHPTGNNGSPVEQLRHETLRCPPQASSPRDQGACHLQTSSRRESPSSDNPAAILQMIAQLLVPIYQSA